MRPREADYIRDTYGSCERPGGCLCRKLGPWLGASCAFWRPLLPDGGTWQELKAVLLERSVKADFGEFGSAERVSAYHLECLLEAKRK